MEIEKEFEETVKKLADMTGVSEEQIKETINSAEDFDDLLDKASELIGI